MSSPGEFSSLTGSLPVTFTGAQVEIRGFLKTADVTGFCGLWLREDGDSGAVAFDNMRSRNLNGTTGWTEFSVILPLEESARRLFFGVLLSGQGRVWADDLRILVDGKPPSEAAHAPHRETILDRDHEFDGGSGIRFARLDSTQIENLVMLAKVWGFLKYHHPSVIAGKVHWDFSLFRVLPAILAAESPAAAQAAVLDWIAELGAVERCEPCASLDSSSLVLAPSLDWLRDEGLLGSKLAERLQEIHRNRPAGVGQFYVTVEPVGNPRFEHELAYPQVAFPDSGYQLLALFRLWNILEYWYPYRDLAGDLDESLREFIPRFAIASDRTAFARQLLEFLARIGDTHVNLWGSLELRPPEGPCRIPMTVRFIDENAVVSSSDARATGDAGSLRPGDVLRALDGVPVARLVAEWIPFYAGSNRAVRLRDIAAEIPRGSCGPVSLRIDREGSPLDLETERLFGDSGRPMSTHDLPGSPFRRLSSRVAYLKLSAVALAEVGSYVQGAMGTDGWIIDLRSYPSAFLVFALGTHLVDRPTPFARFTECDLSNPGAFHWTAPLVLQPEEPHYAGKIVILVDEMTQSSAEYHAMAFRASPAAQVLGSTTAGADGNVSPVALPGGLRTTISGLGVFHADGRPTQQVGILPDVVVVPTVDGVRAGRDELVEQAIREIVGTRVPEEEVRNMARASDPR